MAASMKGDDSEEIERLWRGEEGVSIEHYQE